MRRKDERSKQGQTKQTRQSNTAHPTCTLYYTDSQMCRIKLHGEHVPYLCHECREAEEGISLSMR